MMLRPQPTYTFLLELYPLAKWIAGHSLNMQRCFLFLLPLTGMAALFIYRKCPLHSPGLTRASLLLLWALLPVGSAHTSTVASIALHGHGPRSNSTQQAQELLKGSVCPFLTHCLPGTDAQWVFVVEWKWRGNSNDSNSGASTTQGLRSDSNFLGIPESSGGEGLVAIKSKLNWGVSAKDVEA